MPDVQETNPNPDEGKKAKKYSPKTAIALYKALPVGLRRIIKGALIIAGVLVTTAFLHSNLEKTKFLTENLLTLSIATVVIIQAYIYVGQWNAMNQGLEIERAKTNPRLRVSKIRMENFEPGKSPVFITTIANEGLVDATGVELHIGIKFGIDKEFNWIDPQIVMIPARGAESYPIVSGAILNEKLIEGFNTNVPIEVKVRVKYWPGSPTEPKEFCYRYLPWHGERPEDIPQFVPCDFKPHLNTIVKVKGIALGTSTGKMTANITPSGNLTNKVTRGNPPDGPKTDAEKKGDGEETRDEAN